MQEVLRSLSETFDAVLVDGPPVGRGYRPGQWSRLCDGAVLVASPDQFAGGQAREAAARLRRSGATVMGAVLSPAVKAAEPESRGFRAGLAAVGAGGGDKAQEVP